MDDVIANLPQQLDMVINDGPKRSACRGQVSHNGRFACDYCVAEGVAVQNEHNEKSTIRWPHDVCAYASLRTNADARAFKLPGMVTQSPLLDLDADKFDIVEDMPVESMHLLVNVVKRLFELSFSGTEKTLSSTTKNFVRPSLQTLFGMSEGIQVNIFCIYIVYFCTLRPVR